MEKTQLIGIAAAVVGGLGLGALLLWTAGPRSSSDDVPAVDAPPAQASVASPERKELRRVTPPAAAPAPEPPAESEGSVSCAIRFMYDDEQGFVPPLEHGEIAYRTADGDDPENPPTFPISLHGDRISFDPPEGVSRGIVRVEHFLETSISWSEAGCANVLLRPAAIIRGRVDPSYGEPQVIGCGTSARVTADGTFEMQVAPGSCTLRAVRDDDGLLVDSDSVSVEALWGEPATVELVLPED